MVKESTIYDIIKYVKEEITSVIDKIDSWLFAEPVDKINTIEVDLIDEIEKAHKDWINSKIYFSSVMDPDLIDHAIYMEKAARKKYEYLLKKAKNAGITGLKYK